MGEDEAAGEKRNHISELRLSLVAFENFQQTQVQEHLKNIKQVFLEHAELKKKVVDTLRRIFLRAMNSLRVEHTRKQNTSCTTYRQRSIFRTRAVTSRIPSTMSTLMALVAQTEAALPPGNAHPHVALKGHPHVALKGDRLPKAA